MSVIFRHALPNSLLPFITQVGLSIPLLIGGSVVVESIFAWPGIGKLAYDAALRADYMLLMGLDTLLQPAGDTGQLDGRHRLCSGGPPGEIQLR